MIMKTRMESQKKNMGIGGTRFRCLSCGRFVAMDRAIIIFTPDNEFGPEVTEIFCRKCGNEIKEIFNG